jgi:membrane protease subunit HflC
MNIRIIAGIAVVVIAIAAFSFAYTVDETEQVVITKFSKVNRTVPEPGLHFKVPIIEQAVVYPRNLQEWDGDPGEIPTKDKTYIYVDTFARWKIVDPVLFFQDHRPGGRLGQKPFERNYRSGGPQPDYIQPTDRNRTQYQPRAGHL